MRSEEKGYRRGEGDATAVADELSDPGSMEGGHGHGLGPRALQAPVGAQPGSSAERLIAPAALNRRPAHSAHAVGARRVWVAGGLPLHVRGFAQLARHHHHQGVVRGGPRPPAAVLHAGSGGHRPRAPGLHTRGHEGHRAAAHGLPRGAGRLPHPGQFGGARRGEGWRGEGVFEWDKPGIPPAQARCMPFHADVSPDATPAHTRTRARTSWLWRAGQTPGRL